MFCSSISTDAGRTQVVHDLSSGDEHPVQDRGLQVGRCRAQVMFDDFPGAPSPIDAALELVAAVQSGANAIFTHPLLPAAFLACVGDFKHNIDESGVITGEIEFIPKGELQPIAPSSATSQGVTSDVAVAQAAADMDDVLAQTGQLKVSGETLSGVLQRLPDASAISSGLDLNANFSADVSIDLTVSVSAKIAASISASASASVTADSDISAISAADISGVASASAIAAASASAALIASASASASTFLAAASYADASVGLFGGVSIDARVAVESWKLGNVANRQIAVDAARISNNIAIMIEAGGFELDLELWPAFQAAILLGDAVRSAAISATSEVPSVFVMRIQEPTAVLALAARTYGGLEAQERARQISEMNDIATPSWMEPGDYLMPTRSSSQRTGF